MSDARSRCVEYFASQPCPECTANGPCSDPLHVAVPSDAPYMRALFRDVLKPCDAHPDCMCMLIDRVTRTASRCSTPCQDC